MRCENNKCNFFELGYRNNCKLYETKQLARCDKYKFINLINKHIERHEQVICPKHDKEINALKMLLEDVKITTDFVANGN